MVHQHSVAPAVPEELYNLTQLADVTLAAGKLRTDTATAAVVDALGRSSDSMSSAFTPVRQGQQLPAVAATSSSDDDTDSTAYMRNYAHKIFDRRKARHNPTTIGTVSVTLSASTTPATCDVGDDAHRRQWPSHPIIAFQHRSQLAAVQGPADRPMIAANEQTDDDDDDDDIGGLVMCDEYMGDDGEGVKDDHCDDDGEPVAEGDDTDIHVCPECGKKYSTSSNLARHRQTHR